MNVVLLSIPSFKVNMDDLSTLEPLIKTNFGPMGFELEVGKRDVRIHITADDLDVEVEVLPYWQCAPQQLVASNIFQFGYHLSCIVPQGRCPKLHFNQLTRELPEISLGIHPAFQEFLNVNLGIHKPDRSWEFYPFLFDVVELNKIHRCGRETMEAFRPFIEPSLLRASC